MKRLACFLSAIALLGTTNLNAQSGPMPEPKSKSPSLLTRVLGTSPEVKPKWTQEELQLQMFWANYYRNLAAYYASLENVDWVSYYKRNGYPIDPRFYNPYGMNQNMTLVPMTGQPIMVPSGTNPIVPASMISPVSGYAPCSTCTTPNGVKLDTKSGDKAPKTNHHR